MKEGLHYSNHNTWDALVKQTQCSVCLRDAFTKIQTVKHVLPPFTHICSNVYLSEEITKSQGCLFVTVLFIRFTNVTSCSLQLKAA